jgi:hypothetical protein
MAEVRFPAREKNCYLLHSVQTGCGAHPASYEMGTTWFPAGVKCPGREADHSSPSSAELKNGGTIPSLPHVSSQRGFQLIEPRDNLPYLCLGSLCLALCLKFFVETGYLCAIANLCAGTGGYRKFCSLNSDQLRSASNPLSLSPIAWQIFPHTKCCNTKFSGK